ncbi:MAG: site-2 protease family protein [Gemmatimonadetes bacterium]|nr:site-2 protease family protein [Gemmatimonadota bacterium]
MIPSFTGFFVAWRTVFTRDREIVDALVHPDHQGPSPQLSQALDGWPGIHYWNREDGPGRLVLIRPLVPPQRERWWLHGVLFLATFLTVAAGGALLAGAGVMPSIRHLAFRWDVLAHAAQMWVYALLPGMNFAMALMGILLAHECGHYFLARRYAINASPPYFLPAPPQINFIGTFGAFIRLRSPIADRRQLMDVGAAGPWAGFIVAIVFLLVGLPLSQGAPASADSGLLVMVVNTPWHLGDSLITLALREWFFGGGALILHPLALAGWFGIFVTALNLLPIGQLDGGHILYALIGRRQAIMGRLMWLALIPLGHWFIGWWIVAAFILIVSRGRIVHPSVLDAYRSIPQSRRVLGWATVALFVVTFTPVPLYI